MGGTLIQTYLTLHQKAWGSLGQNISQNRNLYRAQESPTYELSIVMGRTTRLICYASVFSPWNLKQPA